MSSKDKIDSQDDGPLGDNSTLAKNYPGYLATAKRVGLGICRALFPETLLNWKRVLLFFGMVTVLILSVAFIGPKDEYIYPFKKEVKRIKEVSLGGGDGGHFLLTGNLSVGGKDASEYENVSIPIRAYRKPPPVIDESAPLSPGEPGLISPRAEESQSKDVNHDFVNNIYFEVEVTDSVPDTSIKRKVLFTSLLPQIICVSFAVSFHSVYWALFLMLLVGITFGFNGNLFVGFERCVWPVITDISNVYLLLFNVQIVGTVFLMQKTGGLRGMVNSLTKYTDNALKVRLMIIFASILLFFDDYANSIVVGTTFRPVTDYYKISREKLAYLVDSTSAPICGLALVSTWIGVELAYIYSAIKQISFDLPDGGGSRGIHMDPYRIFLNCLPYRFYCISTLISITISSCLNKDWGPMLWAERRSHLRGEVYAPDAKVPRVRDETICEPDDGVICRWYNCAVPILILVIGCIIGLFVDGLPAIREKGISASILNGEAWKTSFSEASPGKVLFFSSLGCTAAAILMPIYRQTNITISPLIRAYLRTIPTMLGATCILILAWSAKESSDVLGTTNFLASFVKVVPIEVFPLIAFILSSLIGFSIGSSWGTMSVLIPLAIPLFYNVLKTKDLLDFGPDTELILNSKHSRLLFLTISAVMDGAICGDHCSPISDTTVLSSTASQCDLIHHVITQLPYALLCAMVALIFGHVCVARGMHVVLYYLLSTFIFAFVFLIFGTDIRQYQDPDGWKPDAWDVNVLIFGTDAKWIEENRPPRYDGDEVEVLISESQSLQEA